MSFECRLDRLLSDICGRKVFQFFYALLGVGFYVLLGVVGRSVGRSVDVVD